MAESACGCGDMYDPEHRAVCITCNGAWRRRNVWGPILRRLFHFGGPT